MGHRFFLGYTPAFHIPPYGPTGTKYRRASDDDDRRRARSWHIRAVGGDCVEFLDVLHYPVRKYTPRERITMQYKNLNQVRLPNYAEGNKALECGPAVFDNYA